jgi:hypothetical protein
MCMHDSNPEAQQLRQRAVTTSVCAACLGTLITFNGNSFMHQHHGIMFGVMGLQVGMIAKALHLMTQRKRLLRQVSL